MKTAAEWHEEVIRLDGLAIEAAKRADALSRELTAADHKCHRLYVEAGKAWEAWNAALIAEREQRNG